jgi:hypothetical protein
MAVDVIVQVRPEAARELSGQRFESPGAKEVAETVSALGSSLEQMHPGVSDATLAQYFTVQVPEESAARDAVDRLLNCEAVEAAYVKPSDEMP